MQQPLIHRKLLIILLAFINIAANSSAFAQNKFRGFNVDEVSSEEINLIVDYTYTGDFGTGVRIFAVPLQSNGESAGLIGGDMVPLRIGDNTVTFNIKKKPGVADATTVKIRVVMTQILGERSARAFLTEEMPYTKVWRSSSAATCSISGHVTGSRHATVDYGHRGGIQTIVLNHMTLWTLDEKFSKTAELDGNGRYEFTNIPVATYKLGPAEAFIIDPNWPTIGCKAGEPVRIDFVIRGPVPAE